MGFLSVMSKGTTEEKIMWSFDFLDLDRNGFIEKQEMLKVKPKFKLFYRYFYFGCWFVYREPPGR